MFARILTCALFAGAGAGLGAGLLQLAFVQPVLLEAELYETGAAVHFGAGATGAVPLAGAFEPVRNGLSILFSVLTYTGFALMLAAAMALAERRGIRIDARRGLLWGIAGFVVFFLAPGFSLAPEVPGVAAADLQARQIWWFATVAAAAGGIALIAFARSWPALLAAAVLLLAPHVVGAPQPAAYTGPVPPEIGALFSSRALGAGFAAWALLGSLTGYFWRRSEREAASPVAETA